MKKKYTFWSLCNAYTKIEVPIIQRDYAQGRQTIEVNILREKFINDFLIESILTDQPVELDFVYGSILVELKDDIKQKTFIPLDGQQRLTTLFLLYYFVAVKEGRLSEIRQTLSRFTYETRPSAHDFCVRLLQNGQLKTIENIKEQIEDSLWFNEEWINDPTVSGMLNMLETFSNNTSLVNSEAKLLDKLLEENNQLVSFYFTDLEEFGLTENLYIRMNARGKMLTDFENFKSEFYKIISYKHDLLEEVKDKIEYFWVENLWDYKGENSFIVDKPFMSYLSFLTELLYFRQAEFRSSKPYESNFLDFRVLKDVYSNEENLRFLIFSFDYIKEIKENNWPILWEGESLHDILKDILADKRDIVQIFILFSTLLYSYGKKPNKNLSDFIRVVRNLIANTDDNSRREWPRLISSVSNLISDENVYELLVGITDDDTLIGFNVDQRKEEIFKAELFKLFPLSKQQVFEVEDHPYLTGRISNFLIVPFVDTEDEFKSFKLVSTVYSEEKLRELFNIFVGYREIAKNEFNHVWGNLLISDLYTQTDDSRLIFSGNYKRHPSIILFAKRFVLCSPKKNLKDYIIKVQKDFVNSKYSEYDHLSKIRNVKEQLYLYYIIEERIYNLTYREFFKNGNFNFGWLSKEKGFKSHFSDGIEGCKYFSESNPIFQTYNQLFRYNLGLNPNNTLNQEIIGGNKKRNPFDLIIDWANS